MATRRAILSGIAAGLIAPAAASHTLYGQWVAYRRKHLLIGCHRKDLATYDLALRLVDRINHSLPAAKARAARAPHPQRLASLLGTDQMEVAVLSVADAIEMSEGRGRFAPYGRLPLTRVAEFGPYLLIADADFPARHGWMLAASLDDAGQSAEPAADVFDWHHGVSLYRAGISLEQVPAADRVR